MLPAAGTAETSWWRKPARRQRYGDRMPAQDQDAAGGLEPHVTAAIVDVFVYVTVLNLFVQYLPRVLSENFTPPC